MRACVPMLESVNITRIYLQIVHFYGEEERREFVTKLRTYLRSENKHFYNDEKTYNEMITRAVTKEKRDELLTKFFKGVVAEVSVVYYLSYTWWWRGEGGGVN